MSEEILREVIGVAKKTNWNKVKRFIKFIVQKTLKKGVGYKLNALDALINGKKKLEFNLAIKSKEEINEIENIQNFNHLIIFQSTEFSNNVIDISQNNGTLIVLAKYFGPAFNNNQIFDFSVHLDALNEPFFSIGNGKKINCSEILKFIKKISVPNIKTSKQNLKKKSKKEKHSDVEDIEVNVFEKLTGKNAIWNGTETKNFQKWKAKLKNRYRVETGKINYYKGKPTRNYSQYLENILKNKENKAKKFIKKENNIKSVSIKEEKDFSEKLIFESIIGKNAIWNGVETKNFKNWKCRIHKKYNKETGKNPYYRGKLTQKFQLYLKKLPKPK